MNFEYIEVIKDSHTGNDGGGCGIAVYFATVLTTGRPATITNKQAGVLMT